MSNAIQEFVNECSDRINSFGHNQELQEAAAAFKLVSM